MDDPASDRLIAQRLRNRMMEKLLCLVEWEKALEQGAGEYFNSFFDSFPDELPLPPNSALSQEEYSPLTEVTLLMIEAANGTQQNVTEAELIASGWPERIKPVALRALSRMIERGRFSEEMEENEPSSPIHWPSDGWHPS